MLSKRAKNISPSQTLTITARAKAMKKDGLKVFNLAAGEPDFGLLPEIKKTGIEAIETDFNKYTPTSGIPELKEAISQKFLRDNKLNYSPEEIIVSNGAKQILYNIFMSLAESGDEIILPVPYWNSYLEQIKLSGAKPVFCPTKNFQIISSELEKLVNKKTKAIVLNYPANPSGATISKNELKKIAKLAVEKNIFIISDEVYEYFLYDNKKHTSIASLNNNIKERTITVNAVSKSYAMTGLRLGYAAGPKEIIAAMTSFQDHTTSGASSISQKMAIAALKTESKKIKPIVDRYEKRRNFFVSELNKMGLTTKKSEGTFYVFPSIKKTGLSSLEFCERLLNEKFVATIPGDAFNAPDNIRISFAGEEKDLKEGLKKIKEFVLSL